MIFHWKLDSGEIHTKELLIGKKVRGHFFNHRRADYVTITREEIRDYRREVGTERLKEHLYNEVHRSLYPGGKVYCE